MGCVYALGSECGFNSSEQKSQKSLLCNPLNETAIGPSTIKTLHEGHLAVGRACDLILGF